MSSKMEIIKSTDTEEIGIVLSKEESEALAFALSRFTCHNKNVLSKLVCDYLEKSDIDYNDELLNSKYERKNRSFGTAVTVFSLSVD